MYQTKQVRLHLHVSLTLQQNLAAQKNYNNLNMTMQEAIEGRWCCIEGVLKCYPHETLETIIDRIAEAEVLEQIVAMLHVTTWQLTFLGVSIVFKN